MGSDDLFKKRREARKKRSHEFKTPKANSYLIVTEGECTEPYYFNGVVNGRFCPQPVRSFCPIVAGFNAGTYKVPACVL